MIAYGLFTMIIFTLTTYWISTRIPLEASILRDRNMLYRTNYLGIVENTYTLKILNKTQQDSHYKISVAGLENANLTLPKNLMVKAGVMREFPLTLSVDSEKMNQAIIDISFTIQSIEQPQVSLDKSMIFYSGMK